MHKSENKKSTNSKGLIQEYHYPTKKNELYVGMRCELKVNGKKEDKPFAFWIEIPFLLEHTLRTWPIKNIRIPKLPK